MLEPRNTPCATCPYRCDSPSGLWHPEEYAMLVEYDRETGMQPDGVFMCHDARDGSTMCRGWLDVHGADELLAVRYGLMFKKIDPDIVGLPKSDCETFASGAEAAAHGMRDIVRPGIKAVRSAEKIKEKLERQSCE